MHLACLCLILSASMWGILPTIYFIIASEHLGWWSVHDGDPIYVDWLLVVWRLWFCLIKLKYLLSFKTNHLMDTFLNVVYVSLSFKQMIMKISFDDLLHSSRFKQLKFTYHLYPHDPKCLSSFDLLLNSRYILLTINRVSLSEVLYLLSFSIQHGQSWPHYLPSETKSSCSSSSFPYLWPNL